MTKEDHASTTVARRRLLRQALGIAALGCLAYLGIAGASWDAIRVPAVVEAGRVFSLSVVEGGRVQWNLRDGSRPGGSSLIRQMVQAYDGADQVELVLAEGVGVGKTIRAGQEVASLRSIRQESRYAEQRAERASLIARRQLLLAGGRPEVVSEAERYLDVVRARREATRAELERFRSLAAEGLVSAMDIEKLELSDEVNRRQIEQAAAAVEVARAAPRGEEIALLDASIRALDATIREAEKLLESTTVHAPIDGVVRVGESGAAFDILDLKTVYLALAVPASQRARLDLGATVRFAPATAPDSLLVGSLVGISEETVLVQGAPSVWASASVDNSRGILMAGMAGTAEIETSGSPLRYLTGLGRSLLGGLS